MPESTNSPDDALDALWMAFSLVSRCLGAFAIVPATVFGIVVTPIALAFDISDMCQGRKMKFGQNIRNGFMFTELCFFMITH